MRIQHLISTMSRVDFDFINNMNLAEDVLVVNQKSMSRETLHINDMNYCCDIINTPEVGLSNSRNMLLKNASGDICVIGDDDLIYRENYSKAIRDAYESYPNANIIVFRFSENSEIDTRKPFNAPRLLNIFNISKVASVEITFKRQSIVDANILFDPVIGLGTYIGTGEENAFLADSLRKGLKIQYVPFTICHCFPDDNRIKWKNGYDSDYFIKKGAAFYRIFHIKWHLFAFAFLLTKSFTTFRNINCLKAFIWMTKGKNLYLKEKKQIYGN